MNKYIPYTDRPVTPGDRVQNTIKERILKNIDKNSSEIDPEKEKIEYEKWKENLLKKAGNDLRNSGK